jgi:dimethylglycine oxidase
VRSAAYGHTVAANVAYAYLPAALDDAAAVRVEVLGRPVDARLAPDVLVDPENARVRA